MSRPTNLPLSSNIDDAAAGVKHVTPLAVAPDTQHKLGLEAHAVEPPPVYDGQATFQTDYLNAPDFPTEQEMRSLRRVAATVPWKAYAVGFVELCERFSYYGTSVIFTDFIQQPRPAGSPTGAGINDPDRVSGALGMGQRASLGLTTFNSFWVYTVPLFGAYVADTYL
jgi:proton-dependent oligopeptide transporter, POT family